jgi:hypothetical protein
MKTSSLRGFWFCAALGAVALSCPFSAVAQMPPGGGGGGSSPGCTPLNTWSFRDHTNWTSDQGTAPVSFTNLNFSSLGDGSSLVVDTNVPAWLHFNVMETNSTTNLTVDAGTVMFWFAPSWSGTNAGGSGPGVYGRLLEAGAATADSSYGWWSVYVDDTGANLYFSAQTNNLSSNVTTYVSAPISWTTNYFHHVALTYTATNTALFLDGELMTNGPGMTVYPGPEVLTNGFFIGSDAFGQNQACGLFSKLTTYAVPMDAGAISQIFTADYLYYMISPLNTAMFSLSSAPSTPAYTTGAWNAITGSGYLLWVTNTDNCITSTNVWITNMVATLIGPSQTMNYTFTIAGGADGAAYDVFAIGALGPTAPIGSPDGTTWAWMGQGYHCNTYMLTVLPVSTAFFILGTPQDSDLDGLTDAFEQLASHTDPNDADTDGDGVSDAIEWLQGRNPFAYGAQPDTNGVVNLDVYTPLN